MVSVNEGWYSFTCHPLVYPQVEWAISAFTPQLQSITAVWLMLILLPGEGRRLSWPGWLGEILSWFACPKTVTPPSISHCSQESNLRPSRVQRPNEYTSVSVLFSLSHCKHMKVLVSDQKPSKHWNVLKQCFFRRRRRRRKFSLTKIN